MEHFMRVIAGGARRVELAAPAGTNTRPTADRAKEALFNILAKDITGARFLDLFCGSGAVGIEAMSRGAGHVAFVEQEKNALQALRLNLQRVKKANADLCEAEIFALPVSVALDKLCAGGSTFDIIFLDPPYESGGIDDVLAQLGRIGLAFGQIIAETDVKLPLPATRGFELTEQRDYGRTRFLFYKMEKIDDSALSRQL
jgi:16S rRNA (guanine(966)-N(2))-methyltransferase RsmD